MAITATTSVLTGEDWKYAKDLMPGDWVFNRLGKPVKVKTAQIYRSEECYRVTFSDYLFVEGDNHLAFPSETVNTRDRAFKYQGKKRRPKPPRVIKCADMLEEGLTVRETRYKFSVPTTEPIQLPQQPLDIPPFIYGFWYMARRRYNMMGVPYEFEQDTLEIFKNNGYKVEIIGDERGIYQRFRTTPSIWKQLVGNMPTKIPAKYLNGSHEQRLELIRGILSARPCKKMSKRGFFTFKSSKKHISQAFQYLAESLGAVTTPKHDEIAKTHDVKVQRLQPFLPQMAPQRPFTHYARRYVKSIKAIPAQLCVHIETDDEDGSFLAAEGFIPCH